MYVKASVHLTTQHGPWKVKNDHICLFCFLFIISRPLSGVKLFFFQIYIGNSVSLPLALKTLGLSTDNLHVGDDENVTLDTFKEEV